MLRFNFLDGLPFFLQKKQCVFFMWVILFFGFNIVVLARWGLGYRNKYQIKHIIQLRQKLRQQSLVLHTLKLNHQSKKIITPVLHQYQRYRLMLDRLHCVFHQVASNIRLTYLQYQSGQLTVNGEAYNANVINTFSMLLTRACSFKVTVDRFTQHKGGLFGYSISADIKKTKS